MIRPSSALLWGLLPLVLLTVANRASADVISAGFVTCIPENGDPSCVAPAPAGQGRWRVVNMLWTGNGMAEDTDLLDVTLSFRFEGGARSWHWDTVQPGTAFVETDPFDRAMIATMTELSLTATLGRTTFDPVFRGDPFKAFVAASPFLDATESRFPPPLDLFVQGDFVQNPTPEPATLALFGTGTMVLAMRSRPRVRQRPGARREGA